MENWIKRIFLSITRSEFRKSKNLCRQIVFVCTFSFATGVLQAEEQRILIEPDVVPVKVDEALIDVENFELGGFAGVMNIEDFESEFIVGARIGYHLSEYVAFEGSIGMTESGETSFEKLGNVQVLTSDERDYSYYSFGLNLKLPGESYFGPNYVMNNNLSLHMSMGTTDFAGDKRLTGIVGLGYQLLLNDWLSLQLTAREHLYKIDVVGAEKMSYNSEFAAGVSFFF